MDGEGIKEERNDEIGIGESEKNKEIGMCERGIGNKSLKIDVNM